METLTAPKLHDFFRSGWAAFCRPTAVIVYAALWHEATWYGVAYTSTNELARSTGLSRPTVRKALRTLAAFGLILPYTHGIGGGRGYLLENPLPPLPKREE